MNNESKIGAPISDFKKTEYLLRFQNLVREGKAKVSGNFSDKFEAILETTNSLLSSLIESENGQKNFERIFELSRNLSIPEEDLKDSFLTGLSWNLKAGYRLGFFKTKSDQNTLLENLIGSYTLSFRQTLRYFDISSQTSKKENPHFILGIAQKAYLLDPDIYHGLIKKYQNDDFVDKGMIRYSVINNSKDPEAAIIQAKKLYIQLKFEYQNDDFVEDWMLKRVVIHNPNNFLTVINKSRENYIHLREEFQGDDFVEDWMLKHFAVNYPTDARANLVKARENYIHLKEKFQGDDFVEDWMLKHSTVYCLNDPKTAIIKAKENYLHLKEEFKGDSFAEEWILKYFVVKNPKNPETAIIKAKKAFDFLITVYPDLLENQIKYAVIRYPTNPEVYLSSLSQLNEEVS